MFRARQTIFESGDKAGKFLSRYIKQKESKSSVAAVMTGDGSQATKPREINDAFKNFYINLYTSENTATDKEIMSFLNKLNLPKLSVSQQEDLDLPISSQEILDAIKALPSGKSPGQDGFTAEFFKCYAEDLLPLFENMLAEAFEVGKLPPSLNQAIITLILKKEKDPTDCKSYRPIS